MYLVYKGYYNYIPVEVNTEKEAAVALAKTLDGGSVWDENKEDFIFDWGDIEED